MSFIVNQLGSVPAWVRGAIAATAIAACSLAGATEVNTATQADLEKVRGIGTSLSKRLIDERTKKAFADWSDLAERVRGVGPSSAQKLSEAGLKVNGKPYAGASAAAAAPAPARKASN
jgi:competence protein ComEA